jgi:alkylation response protein AidB-like acyl-CoA dehydrogenase
VPYIYSYGTEEMKRKYLPKCASGEIITSVAMTEPDVGSDIAGMVTTAVEEGDEIVINGTKTFISNGINTGLAIVACRNPEIENPYAGISLYLIQDGTPGFTRGKHLDKMGMHSQDTAELFFTNCRIPKSNILGDKGGGFQMLMAKLQQERLVCGIGAVAAAQIVLEEVIEKLKETKYTTGKSLTKTQSVQFSLVELMTDIKIGRTFVEKLVADHMEGLNVLTETVMAKFWTTDMLNRTISKCLDYFGDDGLLEDNPLVQGFRDVRIMTIFAGTNEIMKMVAAGDLGL